MRNMNRSFSLPAGLAVLAVALLAALLPSSAAAAILPHGFWGLVQNEVPTHHQARVLKAGGVESVRVPINWAAVQPTPGAEPDWGSVDPFVKAADEAGQTVLPFLASPPTWAVGYESIGDTTAPRTVPIHTATQRRGWRRFLRLAVFRYGPHGSFWTENPLLPKRPIRIWQIWNEENYKYFTARPNPAQYGRLVVQSFQDLRSADRGARIVLGGLFIRPRGGNVKPGHGRIKRAWFAADFLERMYRTTPAVRGKFLAVALHPYTPGWRRLTPEIEEVRTALARVNDKWRAIWLTELGWSSGHPEAANGRNKFEKGWRGQARELRGAFRLLERNAANWRIRRVYWFSFTDSPGTCNFCDGSGLFRQGFRPKPSWNAYRSFAR